MTETKAKGVNTWADLFDLESRTPGVIPTTRRPRPGRPSQPVKRSAETVTLTDEEKRILRSIQVALHRRIPAVSRGQVVGLALRQLEERLQASLGRDMILPETVENWHDVLKVLKALREGELP